MEATTTAAAAAAAEEENKMKVLVAIDESDGSFYALRWALDQLFSKYPASSGQEQEQLNKLSQCTATFPALHLPRRPRFSILICHINAGTIKFVRAARGEHINHVVYATPIVIDAVKKAQEENAANILSRALQMCKEKKVKAETLVLEGDPKDKICQVAEELHVDLVVVGSRGLGTIKRVLLGSVSNYCAHNAHCPVLIVKPPPNKLAHD